MTVPSNIGYGHARHDVLKALHHVLEFVGLNYTFDPFHGVNDFVIKGASQKRTP
jgi:hypothetical protein